MVSEQAKFIGWARVEINGHNTHIGHVTTEAYGQAVLFRIDRPEIPESEETLEHSEWVDDQRCPAGSIVKRAKIEAVSVLVGAGSIYRIIPCTEAAAISAIRSSEHRPLMVVKLAETPALPAGTSINREFECCEGNPEDGHSPYCIEGDGDDEEREMSA